MLQRTFEPEITPLRLWHAQHYQPSRARSRLRSPATVPASPGRMHRYRLSVLGAKVNRQLRHPVKSKDDCHHLLLQAVVDMIIRQL